MLSKGSVFVGAVAVVLALGTAYLALGDRLFGVRGADADNVRLVARGAHVYGEHCAVCHGDRLQGQPDWQTRKADGRLPAPPHDASGHTWHHSDEQLFAITKGGIEALAPPGYKSDMPAFAGTLSDRDIWAVLAYIKSTWPDEIRSRQARLNQAR